MVEKTLDEYGKDEKTDNLKKKGEWKDGFCAICSTVKAPYTCVKCGKRVCSEHFVSLMGLCVDCAPVKNIKKEPGSAEQSEDESPESDIKYKKIDKTIKKKETKIDWV